jgi:hypothetical protein
MWGLLAGFSINGSVVLRRLLKSLNLKIVIGPAPLKLEKKPAFDIPKSSFGWPVARPLIV